MDKKQLLYGFLFTIGLIFAASYSIDNRGFHSGIFGIIGCALMLAAYIGFNQEKLKAHDHHTRVILGWLSGILIVLVALNITEIFLA